MGRWEVYAGEDLVMRSPNSGLPVDSRIYPECRDALACEGRGRDLEQLFNGRSIAPEDVELAVWQMAALGGGLPAATFNKVIPARNFTVLNGQPAPPPRCTRMGDSGSRDTRTMGPFKSTGSWSPIRRRTARTTIIGTAMTGPRIVSPRSSGRSGTTWQGPGPSECSRKPRKSRCGK